MSGFVGIKQNKFSLFVYILAIVVCTLNMVFAGIHWFLYQQMNFFNVLMLMLTIYIFFIASLVISVIYFILTVKRKRLSSAYPLLIHITTVLIVFIFPFTSFYLRSNFSQNIKERESMIAEIKKGTIQIENDSRALISLPLKYKKLSSEGEIIVVGGKNNPKIFFFTFRGLLDNFSGFIYTEKPTDPSPKSFGCDPIQLEKKTNNWYWASCN